MTQQFDEHLNEHMHALDAEEEKLANIIRQMNKLIDENDAKLAKRWAQNEIQARFAKKYKGAE